MDWALFFTTFVTIFLAEMGDKTQFAAFAASSQAQQVLPVLLGTVLALAIAGSIGVLAGSVLGRFVDPGIMKYISGAAFIVMGLWILLKN